MKTHRLIYVKLLAPTVHYGTRVSIKSDGHGVRLPYDYKYNRAENQAYDHLTQELGIEICGVTSDDKHRAIYITQDLHTPIKK